MRDNKIDTRRVQELKAFFDSIPENNPCLADIAMIIANPYTTNTIIRNIVDTLIEVVEKEGIPKVCKFVCSLLI